MKINKSSWHYWLNDVMGSPLCSDLRKGKVGICDYFWGTVKSIIKVLGIAAGCIVALGAIVAGAWFVLNSVAFLITGVLGCPVAWVDVDEALGVIIGPSLIAVIGGFVAWLQGEINFAPNYMKIKPSLSKDKNPSLLKSYYFAWKDKVCPFVELDD